VFPEGTRTADGKLKAFKNGAFQAAVLTGKPVVPVAINGTFSLMSRDAVDTGASKSLEERLVTVQIGTPIYPSTELETEEAVIGLRNQTRAAVVKMLEAVNSPAVAAEPTLPLER
jgi:1-acyl-sn-glycerol-3-phosphate acyltransferase